MDIKEIVKSYMAEEVRNLFACISDEVFNEITEIRLRVDKPLIIMQKGDEYFVNSQGQLIQAFSPHKNRPFMVSIKNIEKTMELMSNYSIYAFEDEIKRGYLTLPGGHRVGISGKAVVEQGYVKTIKNINGLNIRISHQIKGCGRNALNYIVKDQVLHTMIISPPGCGKTTLLRDIVRLVSNGVEGKIKGQVVSVIDERSEIGGCYRGIPQNDVGIRTDVLDGCPKAEGMLMVLRSMTPNIIAVDEIGKSEDIYAIEDIINAGINLICTVHGKNILDIKSKPALSMLLSRNIFKRFIVLKGLGEIENIYDENFTDIYTKRSGCL